MPNRNIAIDIAKGIGAILVVLGHNWLVLEEKGEAYRVIYSFHNPLFLFLSGLFIKDSISPPKFVLSRAEALLKPYIVIFFLISVSKAVYPAGNPAITVSPYVFFLRSLYATPGYLIWEWLPLWYISHLFIALILSELVLHITKDKQRRQSIILLIILTSLVIGIWISNIDWLRNPRPPFTSDILPISVAIILSGFLLKEKIQSMRFTFPTFSFAVIAFCLLHYFYNATIDLSLRVYGQPIVSSLQLILGIYITLSVSLFLKEIQIVRHVLTYIGSGSLFVLCFHNFFQVRTYWSFSRWGYGDITSNIAGSILGIAFPLVLWELVKRQRLLSTLFLPRQKIIENPRNFQ